MDALEKWLNKRERHATAALDLYHRDCLENGEPPADMRERINRILALILQSAREDYPYKVLFNGARLKSTSVVAATDDHVANARRVATEVALEAALRALRSNHLMLKPGQRGPTSIAQRIKTEMRAAMRIVCDQYEVPSREVYKRAKREREQIAQAGGDGQVPTLEKVQESTADQYEGPEVVRGEDVATATNRVEGLVGDGSVRADRNVDWQQDEDADSRRASGRVRQRDRLGASGMLGDGHSFGRIGRYVEPMSPAEIAAKLARTKLTPEKWERIEQERQERDKSERRFVVRRLGLQPRMGGFTVDIDAQNVPTVAPDVVEAAEAEDDPFDVAAGLVARGQVTEGAATVLRSQRDESAEFRERSLLALSRSDEPTQTNIVLLEGRRSLSVAERQRKSRAGKAADLIERSAVDTSRRVFEPDDERRPADELPDVIALDGR